MVTKEDGGGVGGVGGGGGVGGVGGGGGGFEDKNWSIVI